MIRTRIASAAVVALFASLLALLAWRASVKPFWHDEIYTILEAELPVATLWRALHDGIDLQPPLNVLLTRGVHLAAGVGPVATRLPAIAGFLLAAIFTFIIVRRRTNGLIATSAVLLLCLTPAWGYAIEARGYGLTFGAFALALFAWTEAAAGRHPARNWILLAVSLAAGVWAHCYFVLAFLPIGLGEITRQIVRKRFSAAPWLALAAAVLLTAPLWTIAAAAAAQRTTFWAVATWNVAPAYRHITSGLFSYRLMFVAVAAVAAVEIARRARARRWPVTRSPPPPAASRSRWPGFFWVSGSACSTPATSRSRLSVSRWCCRSRRGRCSRTTSSAICCWRRR